MFSKKEITEAVKQQFANARERGQVLGRALKVRADIAATRRRLQSAYAELGQHVDTQLATSPKWTPTGDEAVESFRLRVAGLKAEVRQRERELQRVLANEPEEAQKQEEQEEGQPAGAANRAGNAGGRTRKTGAAASNTG